MGDREGRLCVFPRTYPCTSGGRPSIDVGTAGENVTVEGIDWDRVVPGPGCASAKRLTLEVASFTTPCKTIRESFIDGEFVRISHKLHPGWSRVYTRVLSEGEIRAGDSVEFTPPPG